MLEGRVRDGHLVTVCHVEPVDPAQVHKGSVRDPEALRHVYSVQSFARVASNMDEIRVDDIFSSPYVDRMRC